MKEVHYQAGPKWVVAIACPTCRNVAKAWRSSGMSDSCPHFYCSKCSNVILRAGDRELLRRRSPSAELVQEFAASLPACPCGGRFAPGANPKCRACGSEFPHQSDPVTRLTDPFMIVVDGACVLTGEEGEAGAYRMRID